MREFARALQSEKAVFFHSGSTAIYALLMAMNVGPGDEVILPIFTCTAVPRPVVRRGATPVYVDIDPRTFNLDPNLVEAKITPRTRVIIAQHTFGIPAEMDALLDIARRHHLWVIEDAAHALGSRYRGREVGLLGDAAIYSFGWHKPIMLGTGGAALVNNSELLPRVAEVYNTFTAPGWGEVAELSVIYTAYTTLFTPARFWAMKEAFRRLRDFSYGPRKGNVRALLLGQPAGALQASAAELDAWYQGAAVASQGPLPEPQAPVPSEPSPNGQAGGKKMMAFQRGRLMDKLDRWDEAIAHQERVVSHYREQFCAAGLVPFEPDSRFEPVYYKYPVLFEPRRKAQVFAKAQTAGIELSDMFGSPLYPLERAAQWKALGYEKGMCPLSEDISARMIALPVHSKIGIRQIEKTVALLASC